MGFSSGVMRFSLPELSLELSIVMETLTNPSSLISSARVVLDCAVFSLLKLGKTLAGSSIAVLFLRYVILIFYACYYLLSMDCCNLLHILWFLLLDSDLVSPFYVSDRAPYYHSS